MGAGLGAQVGLGDHDDMQWWRALLVAQLHLVQASLDVPLHARLCERLHWDVVISHLGAILTPRTSPRIGASRGEGQCRIAPQLGNEGQPALACHLQRVAVIRATCGGTVAAAWEVFLLPFGPPGRQLAAESFCFLATAVALRAACS